MLTWIREKFGTVVIGAIITLIAFVFVFYGVFNPRATRGLHEGSVAGTVNGDAISIADFNRELKRRTDFFKGLMGGGQVSDEQLKAFRVKGMVFEELVRRKLLLQEAERQGLMASDEEIKEQIQEMPAFQKDGKFDLSTYKQVLEANNYSAGTFERVMREDLSVQRWNDYFKDRVQVSDSEARKRFLISEDKRNIRYVLLTTETGKKGVKVADEEVSKFLADASKKAVAQAQFDREKDTKFKGKTFDQVKDTLAREILAGDRLDEVRKINDGLAEKALQWLTADKSSDAKVNAMLKPYDNLVRSTGMVSRLNPYIPGIGEAKELMADLFAAKSPIDPSQGGKAKKYSSGAWVLVAVISETQKPDLAKFESTKGQLFHTLIAQKQRELFEEWVKKLKAKAKVDPNPAIVSDGSETEEI
jgi:parvulin-like peptidyl-prolyl isomerase